MAVMPGVELGRIESVAVLGGGVAFPARSVTNEEVLEIVPPARPRPQGETREQLRFAADGIRESLGLERRAWAHLVGSPLAHDHEAGVLQLATAAARAALADAGLTPAEVALILCATSTPHRMSATLSAGVGAALGAPAACLDTRAGCSAGLFALTTAALYVAAGAGHVLVVGADTFSKVVPPRSRTLALALGDGAGALVVGPRPGAAVLAAALRTDGTLGHLVTTTGRLPPTHEEIEAGAFWLEGELEQLMTIVPGKYEEALGVVCRRAGLRPGELDLLVPHQTTAPVIDGLCRMTGLPPARVYTNVHAHANIGAAGWIVALVEARAAGRCPPGARVGLAAVGGGLSWAAAVLSC
jgi:3-oxoacyl-(acyl-carrier-protein) synthase III